MSSKSKDCQNSTHKEKIFFKIANPSLIWRRLFLRLGKDWPRLIKSLDRRKYILQEKSGENIFCKKKVEIIHFVRNWRHIWKSIEEKSPTMQPMWLYILWFKQVEKTKESFEDALEKKFLQVHIQTMVMMTFVVMLFMMMIWFLWRCWQKMTLEVLKNCHLKRRTEEAVACYFNFRHQSTIDKIIIFQFFPWQNLTLVTIKKKNEVLFFSYWLKLYGIPQQVFFIFCKVRTFDTKSVSIDTVKPMAVFKESITLVNGHFMK